MSVTVRNHLYYFLFGFQQVNSSMNVLSCCVFSLPGHYCVYGDPNPVPCPEGTYNNATGQDDVLDCIDCTRGMYCEGTGNTLPDGMY